MRVNSCCCCFSLKMGCMIIAMYYAVVSTYLLISSAIDLHDILNDQSVNETSKKAKDPIIIGLLWTFLGVMGLHIVMSLLLLLGAVKEVPVILCLWLAANVVFLVVVVSGMTVRIFLNPKRFLSSIGKRIFSVVLGVYFLVVVKSFHRELRERREAEPV
ncbi:uncharacterized protein [Periplaneta americana]|uniref:uncharacterized protein n=1 Tax=Periplaneta americana TaxID=6978 RepID=UPI0037E91AC4